MEGDRGTRKAQDQERSAQVELGSLPQEEELAGPSLVQGGEFLLVLCAQKWEKMLASTSEFREPVFNRRGSDKERNDCQANSR